MEKEIAELLQVLLKHKGKIVGTLAGLLLGWLVIRFGVIKSLFVALCVSAGYILGKRVDNKEDLKGFVDHFFPPDR
ncbi:MAG: DUF2273 domain-containing protein [Syntrophothermus sp.]